MVRVQVRYKVVFLLINQILQRYFEKIPQLSRQQLVSAAFILRGVRKKPDVVFRNNNTLLGGVALPSNSAAKASLTV